MTRISVEFDLYDALEHAATGGITTTEHLLKDVVTGFAHDVIPPVAGKPLPSSTPLLMECIRRLEEEYRAAVKPYLDRLVQLEVMEPPKPWVVSVGGEYSLGHD